MLTLSLVQSVWKHAKNMPHHPAIVEWNGRTLSYEELWRLCCAYQHQINQQNKGEHSRVALMLPRSADFIAALLGTWLSNRTAVILDPTWPEFRKKTIIAETQPSYTLSAPIKQSPPLPPTISPHTNSDSPAYIIYSSGSGGRPKGVIVPHAGLYDMLSEQVEVFKLSRESRTFWMHGIAFDASISDIGTSLLAGATLCLDPQFALHSSERFLQQIAQLAITHIDIPPSLLSLLTPEKSPNCLRTLIVGGEITPAPVISKWEKSKRVINVYGPTEASICTSMSVCGPAWDKPLIGRPMRNVIYRVIDPASPEKDAETGELHISSPGVALGYLNQSELTSSRFYEYKHLRTFRTGDRVRRLANGEIEFIGRIDRQIKIQGKLLCPEEIESHLQRHPNVKQCHVAYLSSNLVAWVQSTKNQQLDSLILHLERHLPQWMIPTQWRIVDQLPLLNNGKINALDLYEKDKHFHNALSSSCDDTSLSERLVSIMQTILHNSAIKKTDDFFSFGGDSLNAISFLIETDKYGIHLPPDCLYQFRTAQNIARQLTSHSTYQQSTGSLNLLADLTRQTLVKNLSNLQPFPVHTNSCQKNILLTGATGFLGSALLGQLLEKTQQPIICLVRNDIESKKQLIISKLKLHGHVIPKEHLTRIHFIGADIEKERLGLTHSQWVKLCLTTSTIIHCAAYLHLLKNLDEMENVNVQGTRRLLEVLHAGCEKRFIHASTLSVFVDAHPAPSLCQECDELDQPTTLYGGYAQSKWMAEKLIRAHPSSYHKSSIIRLGLLTPNSSTGYAADNDWFCDFVKSLHAGHRPLPFDTTESMDFTPVDYAATAMMEIILHGSTQQTYHIANPSSLRYSTLLSAIESLPPLKMPTTPKIGNSSHFTSNNTSSSSHHHHSLQLLKTKQMKFCTKNTDYVLAKTGLSCPCPTANYMLPYLSKIQPSPLL